jgi:hypothetical protein
MAHDNSCYLVMNQRTTIASRFSRIYIREQFLSALEHKDTAWRHRDEIFSRQLLRLQRRSA